MYYLSNKPLVAYLSLCKLYNLIALFWRALRVIMAMSADLQQQMAQMSLSYQQNNPRKVAPAVPPKPNKKPQPQV